MIGRIARLSLASAIAVAVVAIAPARAAEDDPAGDASAAAAALAERYQTWLDDVVAPIISDYERRGFLSMTSDEARDAFIEAFWRARDPTRGTTENEYQLDYKDRLAHADREFASGKRRGFETDRGRTWVQLGRPMDRQRFAADRRLYPAELWTYEGNFGPQLPRSIYFLFYKPFGAGDFELYDPIADGPERLLGGLSTGRRFGATPHNPADLAALLGSGAGGDGGSGGGGSGGGGSGGGGSGGGGSGGGGSGGGGSGGGSSGGGSGMTGGTRSGSETGSAALSDPYAARKAALFDLQNVSPTLRNAALSYDPSDPGDIRGGRPNMNAMVLGSRLQRLQDFLPVDRSYVKRLTDGKLEDIEVETTFPAISTKVLFHGSFAGGGSLHYAIEIPPSQLSLLSFRGKTSGAFQVLGRLFDADTGEPVLQIDEKVELALSAEEIARLRDFPMAIVDAVAVLPGRYEARLQLRNLIADQVSFVNDTFTVPASVPDRLVLGPLLLVSQHRLSPVPEDEIVPFVLDGVTYLPNTAGEVPVAGHVVAVVEVAVPERFRDKLELSYTLTAAAGAPAGEAPVAGKVRLRVDRSQRLAVGVIKTSAEELGLGQRKLEVTVRGGKLAPVTASAVINVVPVVARPPWLLVQERDRRRGWFGILLAEQSLARGDEGGSMARLEKLIASTDGRQVAECERLAEVLIEQEQYDSARKVLDAVRGDDATPHTHLLLALARSGAGDSAGAIAVLKRALSREPESIDHLNLLGEELLRIGEGEQALAAFQHSLELDPFQSDILELVESVE